MKYQELIILLPCHSLEDFPTYHEGDDAHSLLASWSALWHPALLAAGICVAVTVVFGIYPKPLQEACWRAFEAVRAG